MRLVYESRDEVMLLENRRSHDCGRAVGVPTCDGASSSRGVICLSIPMFMLSRGVTLKALFCPVFAVLPA